MVAAGFIEASNQMRAAGTRGAGTHRELSGELGLAGGGQRRSFLMTDFDGARRRADSKSRRSVRIFA
jgi:hypothetical protein